MQSVVRAFICSSSSSGGISSKRVPNCFNTFRIHPKVGNLSIIMLLPKYPRFHSIIAVLTDSGSITLYVEEWQIYIGEGRGGSEQL